MDPNSGKAGHQKDHMGFHGRNWHGMPHQNPMLGMDEDDAHGFLYQRSSAEGQVGQHGGQNPANGMVVTP